MFFRVINYGGGTNSTALTIEAINRGIIPDIVIFADTGSEMPKTYEYLEIFGQWLKANAGVDLTVVRWIRKLAPFTGQFVSLHQWCEDGDRVPSRAYGLSGCTSKWKQQPVDKYLKNHPAVKLAQLTAPVERWMGFHADEPERAERQERKNPHPELWNWRAPLVDWDIGQYECVKLIEDAGLPLPGKSACWMCPSSKKSDIDRLKRDHPELLERALRMERIAIESGNLASREGLGGRLNWNDYIAGKPSYESSFEDTCGCYDGARQPDLFRDV